MELKDNGVPGPGTYTQELVQSQKDKNANSSFLTNTKRNQDWWENNMDAPFTKPTNKFNPGP